MRDFEMKGTTLVKYRGVNSDVVIPEGVTSIGPRAFYSNIRLGSVAIPASVTEIGEQAFCYCYNLTSVTVPGSVKVIGKGAFSRCDSLTSVVIPEGVTKIGDWAFGNCGHLTNLALPASVTEIAGFSFGGNPSLTIQAPVGSYARSWANENGKRLKDVHPAPHPDPETHPGRCCPHAPANDHTSAFAPEKVDILTAVQALKGLKELNDLGVVTEAELQQLKHDLLGV